MRSPHRREVSAFLATKRPCSHHGGQGHALASLRSRQRGFTLVELVLVIALAGVVAVLISTVLSRPLQGFVDQSRRAELTDQAATALNRMARDIRGAVPNSVRTRGACNAQFGCSTLELLSISEGGRYQPNQLQPDGPRFDPPRLGDCTTMPDKKCVLELPGAPISIADARWLIIYNTNPDEIWGTPLPNPGSILDITGRKPELVPSSADGAQPQQLRFDNAVTAPFSFRYASPQKRFFLADRVVGYQCNGRRLTRGEFSSLSNGYDYSGQPLLADHVDCARSGFTYQPGSHARNALVTLRLSLTRDGETISLVQQVHVDNAP